MARYEARKLVKSMKDFFDYETLEAEAFFGLTDAVARWPAFCFENNYDPEDLSYFQYVVTTRTRGHLYDFIRQQNHLTRTEYERARDIKAKFSQNKTIEQAATELGLTAKDIRKTLAGVANHPFSIDSRPFFKNPLQAETKVHKSTLDQRLIEETSRDPETIVEANRVMKTLNNCFSELSDVHQTILVLRYYCNIGITDISDLLDQPTVVINKLHSEALQKITSSVEG